MHMADALLSPAVGGTMWAASAAVLAVSSRQVARAADDRRVPLMGVLGVAFAFGKASVFKYISDDYPKNIGAISGIVGLAGGLGGFVLPIMFGALMDLTGIRSSAFMLMYGVVWVSLIWMYWTEVRQSPVMGGPAAGTSSGHPH